MYTKSYQIYDVLHSHKDYEEEALKLHQIISLHKQTSGNRLLDVACGTGKHAAFLSTRELYEIEGIDIDNNLLEIARARAPRIPFHLGDMTDFSLGLTFDVVICLFTAIGYSKTLSAMQHAVFCMSAHTKPGGIVVIEPAKTPEQYHVNRSYLLVLDKPDIKISRMHVTKRDGDICILDFYYTVATAEGVQQFIERHEMGLFTHEQYIAAMENCNLTVVHERPGITGRGLYIGIKH